METSLIVAMISGGVTLVVAIITGIFGIQQNQIKKKNEEEMEEARKRAEQRKKESLLNMEMSHANTQLTIGIAMALKHGKCNGEVEEGLKAVNLASENYNKYLREIANETLQEGV